MAIEYIRYRITADKQQEFVQTYTAAAIALDESEYCLCYKLSQCEEEPERFILRIKLKSTQDHLQKFRTSAEFRKFLPHIRSYIDDIDEMQHYEIISIVSS